MPRHALLALAACAALAASTFPTTATAQDRANDPRFELRLSAFNPTANVGLSGDGIATDGTDTEEFSGAGDIDVDGRWRPRGEFVWRISDRNTVAASYYDYRRNESWSFAGDWIDPGAIFDEDPVEIPGVDLEGRLAFNLASINWDYALVDTDAFEWGLGLGVTRAELEARATGQSTGTAELDPEWESVRWRREGTSPNLHTRLTWRPGERWRVEVQGQYLDTRWGDFIDERGHFERGGLLVEYAVTDNVGIHVGYDWFRLKLSDDYRGSFEAPDESDLGEVDVSGRITGTFKVHGPMAGVSFRF